MGFLSPLFLVGGVAALIPVVLHLLKRQHEQRVRFAAVAFLKTAPVERTSRRRLRDWLLLTLRVTALLLLALAFARPFFRSAAATTTGTTVVVLDTSFSMSAPGRFERARELAKDAARNAPAGHEVAVVTFADQAEIVVRPTRDRAAAIGAVDAASAGFGGTRYRAGLNAASSVSAGRPATVVVVTDLQENGWDAGESASLSEQTRVEVRDVGALPANLAVTDLRVVDNRAVATVRNDSEQVRQVRAHLSVDGKAAGEATATLGVHESGEVTFADVRGRRPASASAASAVAVSIDDPGGLPADNARYALLSGTARPSVLVATTTGDVNRDAFYVQHALAAGQAAAKPDVVGVSPARLSSWSSEQMRRHAVVALLSTVGLEPRSREQLAAYVARGGGLLIAAGPDVDGAVIADVLGSGTRLAIDSPPGRGDGEREREPLTLVPADVRHPIIRAFGEEASSLGLVAFRTIARVSGASCQTVARFTSGDAALLDCAAGEGRALIIASDVNNRWNDFPLRASFVPFLHESIRYLAGSGERGTEYLVGDVPAGLAPKPGVVVAPSREGQAGRARQLVVNVDARESDPERISTDEFRSAVTRLQPGTAVRQASAGAGEESRLWEWLLGLMLVTLAFEGVVAARAA